MAEPFITSTIRGRTGVFRLSIDQKGTVGSGSGSGGSLEEIEPEISTLGRITYGEDRIGWHPEPILASFLRVTFKDPTGVIRNTFSSPVLNELDYPVTIVGPLFRWRGAVRRGLQGRPVSPRVHPTGLTEVYVYDRLAYLKEIPGVPTTGLPLADYLIGLFAEVDPDRNLLVYSDLRVENALDDPFLIDERLFDGELVGSGRGNYGSGWQQMVRLCTSHGWLLFENFQTGEFNLVHRGSMATDVFGNASKIFPTQQKEIPNFDKPAYITDVDRSLLRATSADEFVGRAGLSTIILENAGSVNWIIDGEYLVYGALVNDFTYWTITEGTVSKIEGTGRVTTPLSGGGYTAQTLGQFTAETDVRARLTFQYRGTVRSRITLTTAGGTTYWLDSSGMWQSSFNERVHGPSAVVTTGLHLAVEDFPDNGEIVVEIGANSFNNTWGECAFVLVDASNVPIDDWAFRIGENGETVKIEAVPELLAIYEPGGDTESAVITSELRQASYESINDYLVADRFAQDIRGMDNLRGALVVIAGPESVLYLQKDTGEIVNFIANGADVDIERATTQGIWLELPDQATGEISSGSGS